ncbi:reductases with broad range of substrate specificities [Ceraceosorus bombacis]|uniref:Reductases with broad range of substrate specificities n=1 Tax=Ceraceosorus bombacis TaxID=401625 RepID=A0A0N7LA38_9BASI|nr:reductases with broad range of substrate specificities [Ceraceosorus bombacis]
MSSNSDKIHGKQSHLEEQRGIVTAYPNAIPSKQSQSGPGLDKDMKPGAAHYQVETWDNDGKPYLTEYKGTGKLEGRRAIITGGDSGIGRAIALFYAREGAKITLACLPEEAEDARSVEQLVKEGPGSKSIIIVPGDVKDHAYCKSLIDTHIKQWGGLEILVNNASQQIECKDLAEIDLKNVESTFQTNIVAMIALAKFALPHLKRGAGTIINDASVTAYKGSIGFADYAATKGAIVTFTKALAGQLAPKGIRVNAVAPGPVYTPMQRRPEQQKAWKVGALVRFLCTPAELAGAFVFLADPVYTNCMTGQVVHVNNGGYFP